MNHEDVYPLDDQDIELIAEIQREAATLQGQVVGVLRAFVKRHNLPGVWAIAENGREIRRMPGPESQMQMQQGPLVPHNPPE